MQSRSLLAILVATAAAVRPFVSAKDIIVDNDWSVDTFMPLLLTMHSDNASLIAATCVSGNTWAGQGHAYSQRYLQLASEVNSTEASTSGAYRGALLPLLRDDPFFDAGKGLTGTLTFAGAWAPYNATKEAAGADPSGDEANVARVTLQGYSLPEQPFAANSALNASAYKNAVTYLTETAAQYRAQNKPLGIAALGPLTNLALAVKLDPSFATGIDLTYAGGYLNFNQQLLLPGTSSDFFNDFNTLFDPEAAAIVMRANWSSLTLVGEASAVIIPTNEEIQRAIAGADNSTGSSISTPSAFFKAGLLEPAEFGLPIWDEVALLTHLDPGAVIQNASIGYIDIGTSPGSWNYGRTFAYPESQRPAYTKKATIVTTVNRTAVLERYISTAQAYINTRQ